MASHLFHWLKYKFHLGRFSIVFWVPNFQGHFEALNDVFLMWQCPIDAQSPILGHFKCVLLIYKFPMEYRVRQIEII
jgi:hypothetical protein